MEELIEFLMCSKIIEMVVWAVAVDTVFGFARAIKMHKLNSCFGIDGAIRKIAMIVSVLCLAIVDMMLDVNLIGFVPEEVRTHLPQSIATIGISEFFGMLYICYETVSILKNMTLCGLPTKRIWQLVYNFLKKYTSELPDISELEDKMNEENETKEEKA